MMEYVPEPQKPHLPAAFQTPGYLWNRIVSKTVAPSRGFLEDLLEQIMSNSI